MAHFLTSDLHFGHVNILAYEPNRRAYLGLSDSATVEDMNEAIVDLWNRQVGPNDHVIVLGDVCMGKVAETIKYVHRLNGTRDLIMGNHDRPHPIMQRNPAKTDAWIAEYEAAGFLAMQMEETLSLPGLDQSALMCHFPYEGDHTQEERYGTYRPHDTGAPLIHGHIHGLWKTRGRQYNVGIDAWNGEFQTPEKIAAYFRSIGFA